MSGIGFVKLVSLLKSGEPVGVVSLVKYVPTAEYAAEEGLDPEGHLDAVFSFGKFSGVHVDETSTSFIGGSYYMSQGFEKWSLIRLPLVIPAKPEDFGRTVEQPVPFGQENKYSSLQGRYDLSFGDSIKEVLRVDLGAYTDEAYRRLTAALRSGHPPATIDFGPWLEGKQ